MHLVVNTVGGKLPGDQDSVCLRVFVAQNQIYWLENKQIEGESVWISISLEVRFSPRAFIYYYRGFK